MSVVRSLLLNDWWGSSNWESAINKVPVLAGVPFRPQLLGGLGVRFALLPKRIRCRTGDVPLIVAG